MAGKAQVEALNQILAAIEQNSNITHNLLRELIDATKNNNQVDVDQISHQVQRSESRNARTFAEVVANTLKTSMAQAEERKLQDRRSRNESQKAKKDIGKLWKDTLNTRKQAFWTYYKAKTTTDIFQKLSEQNPPKMPRKFLPKAIENECEEETKIRQSIALEGFKAEIRLLEVRSRNYEQRFTKIDSDMIQYFTEKYTEDVVDQLKEFWIEDCKAEEAFSIARFKQKENFYLSNTDSGLKWQNETRKQSEEEPKTVPRKARVKNTGLNRKIVVNNDKQNTRGPNLQVKLNQIPEELSKQRKLNKETKNRKMNFGKKNGRRPQVNQRPHHTENENLFETGTLEALRRTQSVVSIPSNTTIIPETQEDTEELDEQINDNFLFHGQCAKAQDQQGTMAQTR